MQRIQITIFIAITAVFLTNCTAEPAVSPSTTPAPSPPTSSPVPAAAPTQTATAVSTATPPPTPLPTNTQPAAPDQKTATPSPVAPTATVVGLIGPDPFPHNFNPLTGLPIQNDALLSTRPLAIKISNAPPVVRPQAGLNQADLVFEHYAEGGFTRFTVVFYTHNVETVGSVRSARLIDLEIPKMYDAAFAYSGSAGPVRQRLQESEFFNRIISPDFAHGGFYRIENPDTSNVHTLFTNTYNLRYILGLREQDVAPHFANYMAFREQPLAPGTPATRIELWYKATNATWFYSNGRYLRWTDGDKHLDANTGEQLSFKNIVVVAANHVDTDIIEDTNNSPSIEIQIWGEGPVSIFRDGQRFDGRWRREDPHHMLTFTDLEGQILPLAPGNTFFQIVPLGFDQLDVTP